MNLGAHALYRGGAAFLTFNELGMNLPGGIPSTKAHGIWKRNIFTINRFSLNFINTTTFVVCKSTILRLMIRLGNLNIGEVPK